jgi:hypothetical protein
VKIERQVIAYKRYFLDFYENQQDSVQRKIEWTLNFIRITQQVPEKYFKHVEGTKGYSKLELSWGAIFIGYFHSLIKVI